MASLSLLGDVYTVYIYMYLYETQGENKEILLLLIFVIGSKLFGVVFCRYSFAFMMLLINPPPHKKSNLDAIVHMTTSRPRLVSPPPFAQHFINVYVHVANRSREQVQMN